MQRDYLSLLNELDVEQKKVAKRKPVLANYVETYVGERLIKERKDVDILWQEIEEQVKDKLFYYLPGDCLFYENDDGDIKRITTVAKFEAYLAKFYDLDFSKGDRLPSFSRFKEYVTCMVKPYFSISESLSYPLPGEDEFVYLPKKLRQEFEEAKIACPLDDPNAENIPGTIKHMIKTCMPNLATDMDAELMFAEFHKACDRRLYVRPMTIIDANAAETETGQGYGKTFIGKLLAEFNCKDPKKVCDIRINNPRDDTFTQIGLFGSSDPTALFFDNIKAEMLSSSDLEAMITSPRILVRGHRENSRYIDNAIPYIMTINSPKLSRDLAQRAIVIKVNRVDSAHAAQDNSKEYFARYRMQMIKEVHERLARSPERPLESVQPFGRWYDYRKNILAVCGTSQAATDLALRRQEETDALSAEGDDIMAEMLEIASEYYQEKDPHRKDASSDPFGIQFDPDVHSIEFPVSFLRQHHKFNHRERVLKATKWNDIVRYKKAAGQRIMEVGRGSIKLCLAGASKVLRVKRK